ncbi:MAG: lasso peptide biosynthesis B2 protein [Sedimentisphaerales bacterium]|nr:lasso peptide biosynthesis B2 protein [Sedimentisphaerales bacterium]
MSKPRENISSGTCRLLRWHIAVVSATLPLLDRLLTLERMLKSLTPRRASGRYAGVDIDRIAATVRQCTRRARHMRRRACLRTSLLLYHFLRLAGHAPVFHVAVLPPSVDPKRLHAHCWVTVGDRSVSEPPGSGAVEMVTYGADGKNAACAVDRAPGDSTGKKQTPRRTGGWTAVARRV